MSRFLAAVLMLFFLMVIGIGCEGGSGEVGGADLNSDQSRAEAEKARAAYMGAGRKGPGGDGAAAEKK